MVVLTFLFALLMPLVHGNIDTTLIRDRIPDLAKIYCPGRNVCANRTSTQHDQHVENVCCTDCSCDPSCSTEGTCCYEDAYSELKENIYTQGKQEKVSECLFPIIPEPRNLERIRSLSYKMIAKTSKDKLCGERKVAPWGSLYPVSSKPSGRIYKNIKCAETDENQNVTDDIAFETWKAYLICSRKDVIRDILGLVNGSFDKDCKLRFIPSRDTPVSQSDVCYRDIINTCPNKNFTIPDGMTETRNEIIAACHSGLVSPFRKFDMYANVFCYICNRQAFTTAILCDTFSPIWIRSGFVTNGYIGLLDGAFFQNVIEERRYEKKIPETVCLDTQEKGDENCRAALCPSGQLHNNNGECEYPMEEWIVPDVTVQLKLTTETPFAIEQIRGALSGLMSPWPKQWYIESIYTEITGSSIQSHVIVVEISNDEPQRNPYRLLQTVQKSMIKQWKLSMNNNTYAFIADFFYTTLIKDVDNLYWIPTYCLYNRLENVTVQDFLLLYENKTKRVSRHNTVHITKLYLCKQVRLLSSEFLSLNQAMYNNITNRYLLDNEFILLDFEGQTVAQVCLEDSGFVATLVNIIGNMATINVGNICLQALVFSVLRYL